MIATGVSISSLATAQRSVSPLAEKAKFRLEVSRSKARLPLNALQKKYDEALQNLAKSEQAKGSLRAVLAIRSERKEFRIRPSEPEQSEYPALGKLQKIYREKRDRLQAKILSEDIKSLGMFVTELEAAVKALTTQGEVEAAIQVKGQIDSARREIDKLNTAEKTASTPGGKFGHKEFVIIPGGSFDRQGGVVVEKKEGSVLLIGRGRAESRCTLKTPFTLHARVATDSTNIRLYFGQQGVLILNWEVNKNELRLHEPVSGRRHGFGGKGQVVAGKMHDIEIRVSKDRVKIYMDRRKLAEKKGDFTNAEGNIGLGPHGSKLTVEHFKGIQGPASER